MVQIDCAACGYTGVLKTAHKLATYIIKNPPEKGHSKSTESGKVDEVAIAADAAADAAKGAGDAKAVCGVAGSRQQGAGCSSNLVLNSPLACDRWVVGRRQRRCEEAEGGVVQ